MKFASSLLLVLLFSLPSLAKASELGDEFVTRCLSPMINATPFVTENLVAPLAGPGPEIGVDGSVTKRQTWKFPERNWTFGTITAGTEFITLVHSCGITVPDFEDVGYALVVDIMKAVGTSADVCKFEMGEEGQFGYRSVVAKTKRGPSIVVNFSPVNDGDHILIAWEAPHSNASSPC